METPTSPVLLLLTRWCISSFKWKGYILPEQEINHRLLSSWLVAQWESRHMQLLDNVLAGLHSALSLGHTVQLCCVASDSTAVCVHLLPLLPSPEAYGAHLIAVFFTDSTNQSCGSMWSLLHCPSGRNLEKVLSWGWGLKMPRKKNTFLVLQKMTYLPNMARHSACMSNVGFIFLHELLDYSREGRWLLSCLGAEYLPGYRWLPWCQA